VAWCITQATQGVRVFEFGASQENRAVGLQAFGECLVEAAQMSSLLIKCADVTEAHDREVWLSKQLQCGLRTDSSGQHAGELAVPLDPLHASLFVQIFPNIRGIGSLREF
jgi:hypothetical protein